jgi:hypothetical protein
MKSRIALFAVIFLTASPFACAQTRAEEDAACRPDVRRFCSRVPQGSTDDIYLMCLESNRDKLSAKCLKVLNDHGR